LTELTLPCLDAATALFNLPDYRVLKAELLAFGQRRIHVESTIESGCPSCGVIGTRRHSRRRQRLRDIPVAGPVEVIWAKYRLFCDEDLSARRTFAEATPLVSRRARSTRRLRDALVSAVINSGRAAAEAAAAHGVSWWLVHDALNHAATRLPDVDRLREYLKAWRPRDIGLGAGDIAGGGQWPRVWGTPAPHRLFSRGHDGMFTHVVVAGVDPDGVVHDAVHFRIGVHPGAEPLVPVLFGVLGAEDGRGGVVPALQ
jgi:hypothetical protein